MFHMKIIITTCYKYYSHILLYFVHLTCVQFQDKMWTLLCFEPQHNNYVAPETNYKFKWNCIIPTEKMKNPKWKIYKSTLKLWTVEHVLKTILLYNKDAFILAHYQKTGLLCKETKHFHLIRQTDIYNMVIASEEKVSMLIQKEILLKLCNKDHIINKCDKACVSVRHVNYGCTLIYTNYVLYFP